MAIKKIHHEHGPLIFRIDGGTLESSFKKLNSIQLYPTERQIYAGESWIRADFSLKKDKTATVYKGWIRQITQLKALSPAGKLEFDVVNLANIDFMMGKSKKTTPADTTKKDSTAETPPSKTE